MLRNLSLHRKAILALIIANTIWGFGSPIFKWVLTDVHPYTLAFFRFFFAAWFLLPFVYKKLILDKKDLVRILLFSLTGITINIIFYFKGLELTSSINAPIIAAASPIVLIAFSYFFLHEALRKKVIIGTLISLAGILVIILRPLIEKGLDGSVLGNIFIAISTIGAIGHIVLMKPLTKKYSPEMLTFWSFLIATITFLPFFVWENQTYPFVLHLTFKAVFGIIFGFFFSSFVAYIFYDYAIKNVITNEVGIFAYLDPIAAIVVAMPLLGEVLTVPFILGSFFVFFGVFIAEGRLPYHPIDKLRQMI